MSTFSNNYHLTPEDVKNLKKASEISFYTGETRDGGKTVWGSWIQCRFKVKGHDGETTCLIKADAMLGDYTAGIHPNPRSQIKTVHAQMSLDPYETAKKQALLSLIKPGDRIRLIWTIDSYQPDFTDMLIETLTIEVMRENNARFREKNYQVLLDYRLKKPGYPGMISVNRYPLA